MVVSPTTEVAIMVIAAALVVQTALLIGVVVMAVRAGRAFAREFDMRFAALTMRVDDALSQAREVTDRVDRYSDGAADAVGHAGRALRTVAAVAGGPKAVAVASAASVAGNLFAKWRQRRRHPRLESSR